MEHGINTFITESGKNGGVESSYVEETIKVTITLEEYRALLTENQWLKCETANLERELICKNDEIAKLKSRQAKACLKMETDDAADVT